MLFHQVVISHIEIATFSIFHYERCTFASFPMLHMMRSQGDGCCSLFIRKGSMGLVAFFESSSQQLVKRSMPLGLSGKSPHLRVVFSAKTLCKPAPLPLFCYKKDELLRACPKNQHTPIFGRIKKMSLWISKKELEEGDRRESQIQHLR